MNIIRRLLGGLCFLGIFANAAADETLRASLPIITLLVRVHLVQSETMPEMHTTLVEADIRRIFVKVNAVWAQAGIHFEIESIVATQSVLPVVEGRGKPEFALVRASLPKERLGQTSLDICYVKQIVPNGFFYEELIVVKDTASLKEVSGGLDEPLPRVTSHEIGHALGLKHPFDELDADGDVGEAPYLQGAEDSSNWTVMSYVSNANQYHLKLQDLDIAALQYIYGPSTTARTGADTYTISETSTNFIWDDCKIAQLILCKRETIHKAGDARPSIDIVIRILTPPFIP